MPDRFIMEELYLIMLDKKVFGRQTVNAGEYNTNKEPEEFSFGSLFVFFYSPKGCRMVFST